MELIHCQRCGMMPQFNPEHRQRYYMTSCSHLFCQSCVGSFTDQCPHCQRNCSVVELNGQTAPDVKSMFSDPMSVLKDALAKPLQIFQFQKQLNKDKIRVMGKMMDTLKTLRGENSNLKGENNRLRQMNEEIVQERNQLQLKVNELQMTSRRVSPQVQVSPRSTQGQGSDPLNLFRDSNERPNAHVQPIVHPHHSTTPFSIPRTPRSTASLDSGPSQLFGQQGLPGRFTPRSGSPAFATPATHSQFDSGQSPFFQQSANSSGIFGRGSAATNIQASSSSTPNKTPELINRLRNLKCKTTRNTGPSMRF